jgi:hypothetical protein
MRRTALLVVGLVTVAASAAAGAADPARVAGRILFWSNRDRPALSRNEFDDEATSWR